MVRFLLTLLQTILNRPHVPGAPDLLYEEALDMRRAEDVVDQNRLSEAITEETILRAMS